MTSAPTNRSWRVLLRVEDAPAESYILRLLVSALVAPKRFAQFPWNILLLVHVVPCVVSREEGFA
jgi:hypothetical protein